MHEFIPMSGLKTDPECMVYAQELYDFTS